MFYIVLSSICGTIKYIKYGRNHPLSAQYHLHRSNRLFVPRWKSDFHFQCSWCGARPPAEYPQPGIPWVKLFHYLVWRCRNHVRYTSALFWIDDAAGSNAALDRRQFFSLYDLAHLRGRRNNPRAGDLQHILGRILKKPYWCQESFLYLIWRTHQESKLGSLDS